MFFDFHVFCCVNERPDSAVRECCKKKKSIELRNYMKKKSFKSKFKKIRINQSGCLDRCEDGPVIVIYPQGIWYRCENFSDVDEIINSHFINGKIVKRLQLKD